MTQNGPKMTFWYLGDLPGTKNDPKWGKNDPKWPYMAPNDLKRTKNDSKSPKNDILISGGTTPGPKSQKNCSPLSSIFDIEAPFQRYLIKSKILAILAYSHLRRESTLIFQFFWWNSVRWSGSPKKWPWLTTEANLKAGTEKRPF